jgi:hypothetical protein
MKEEAVDRDKTFSRHWCGKTDTKKKKKRKMQRPQPQELQVRPKYENSGSMIGVSGT